MSDHPQTATGPHDESRNEASTGPAQHAARHDKGGDEVRNPQGETGGTTFDTDQHSDAPGPFGTG
jgi:hypothetical protein